MKIAVITGASSGMGREFVLQTSFLYKNLDEIWVIARRKERMEELRKKCRVPLRIFPGDLTKKHIYKDYLKALGQFHPDVRLLVNAAGFGKSGTFSHIAQENRRSQTNMISLNCTALTRMIQMTLPDMGPGSRIINIASAAAFCPQPGFAVYAASKSYVFNFSRALGSELKPRGISVTSVCPGPVDTEFFNVSGKLEDPLKKLCLVNASDVVHKALKDSRKRKNISVYGIQMKALYIGAKVIPHSLILRAEEYITK